MGELKCHCQRFWEVYIRFEGSLLVFLRKLKARLFGVGEEVHLGNNLGIGCFPRRNVCIILGVLHPAGLVGDIVAKRFT